METYTLARSIVARLGGSGMDGVARLQPFYPVSTTYETYQLQQQGERYRKESNLDIRLFLSVDRLDQSLIGIESGKT